MNKLQWEEYKGHLELVKRLERLLQERVLKEATLSEAAWAVKVSEAWIAQDETVVNGKNEAVRKVQLVTALAESVAHQNQMATEREAAKLLAEKDAEIEASRAAIHLTEAYLRSLGR